MGLVACATESVDLPEIVIASPYSELASGWEDIGFRVVEQSELERCARHWTTAMSPRCSIPITVTVFPRLREQEGTLALAIRASREVVFDDDLVGLDLAIAVMHEVGHVVLDTDRHTQGGVMGGSQATLAAVDYDLACDTIGVCMR